VHRQEVYDMIHANKTAEPVAAPPVIVKPAEQTERSI
jgi:hypothetical protein